MAKLLGPLDFFSEENQVLLNPRTPPERAANLRSWLTAAKHLKAHVFILTSGSTAASEADFKWVALSKAAILAAAAGSNAHLECTERDVWMHCLPDFHVGGIGIWARAFLTGSEVEKFEGAWDAASFVGMCSLKGATLCSLVPTQLHDIVGLQLSAPRSMRAVLVGGGSLSEELYVAARELQWPILRTYGMSETASQVATETFDDLAIGPLGTNVSYKKLPHLEVSEGPDARIRVRGASLFTGYVSLDAFGTPRLWDPKDLNGWFLAEDLGTVAGNRLKLNGRLSDRIKIGGEIANLALLRQVLDRLTSGDSRLALLALPDARLEAVVALVAESSVSESELDAVVHQFNETVMPFERIRSRFVVDSIPRSELGKVKWAELAALVSAP